MQRRLEAEGLDRDVVDAAVTCGLEALLEVVPPIKATPAGRPAPRWLWRRVLAKA
jgi:hypothetical protein